MPFGATIGDMVSSVVIGGFAVLDGAILGQVAYAVTQYRRNHPDHNDAEGRSGSSRRSQSGRASD